MENAERKYSENSEYYYKTEDNEMNSLSEKIEKKDLKKVFWRSFAIEASFNYEKMQALGFAFTMVPIIKKLYKKQDEISDALKRHTEFFNTAGQISSFIFGITCAMEEENAKNKNFDPQSINAVKAGLMGPLAGIGDSFFWGTLRVIAGGVGASLMVDGNPLGILLFLLIFNIPHLLVRYFGLSLGYKLGINFLENAQKGGIMQKLTESASIVGLMVIGSMVATMVNFKIPLTIKFSDSKIVIQEVLDQIVPSLLPLGLTFLVAYLLNKKVKVTYILVGLVAFALVGKIIGLL